MSRDNGVSRMYGILMQDPLSLTVPVNASTYTYTVGVDNTDIQLLCQIESYSLPTFRWKRLNSATLYNNPLNISHLNFRNSQEIQCIDTYTGKSILNIKVTIRGPPIITLNNESIQSFYLLPPNMNSAYVTVLTRNVVLSANLAGRWQRPDNSYLASNTLIFSTFYVTQGGVYKFYVNNWDGEETLAIQIGIISNVNNPFGSKSDSEYFPLQNNQIISQDTTLYCITENSNPWSYVDLAGDKTVFNTTVDVATGISTLSVTSDNPGLYSCQIDDQMYTIGFLDPDNYPDIFDRSITSIRTETSSPTSILVRWIQLYSQTTNSNETFSVYYSTDGGEEILAGITKSLKYNITRLLSNVEYRIRIEVNVMFALIRTFSLQTFHLISIPKNPSPLTTEVTSTPSTLTPITNTSLNQMTTGTVSTSTELPISSGFQFTPQIGLTVGAVSIVYILLFALFVIFISIVFCWCKMSKKRSDLVNNEKNMQQALQAVDPAIPDISMYATIENVDKPEFNPFLNNPGCDMEMKARPKESLVETQVSHVSSEIVYYNVTLATSRKTEWAIN